MADARLKFAVVREDPELEADLVVRLGVKAALLVASGGCTALTLAARHPALRVSAFDLNPAQLIHVQWKAAAAEAGERARLNVGTPGASGLNQKGEFEGLFRVLRQVVVDFVARGEELESFFFKDDEAARAARVERWFASPFWPVAFKLALHDDFLHAMFGPDATQHAVPGSYPGYFQAAFERGLRAKEAPANPFLQHVFLQSYTEASAPEYALAGRALPLTLTQGSLLDVPDLGRYQLVSLSNVFDWSSDALVAAWAEKLKRELPPGAAVLMRQLNNTRDLRAFFEPAFHFDDALGRDCLARDRSLFYNRIEVGIRQ
jgi:S-adenosylmethionine-diacylglycerol 3-amino-3-carboxypropyl transferase